MTSKKEKRRIISTMSSLDDLPSIIPKFEQTDLCKDSMKKRTNSHNFVLSADSQF